MAKRISYLYVAMAVLLWSPTAAVGKLLLRNLNNLQFLFFASLIATASLFVIALFQTKLPVIREYGPGDYWRFAYMGFIGVFLYYVLFFAGLALVPAQEAFIVNYTWPVWLVIFAMPILKEEFNHRKLAAILLGFMGVYGYSAYAASKHAIAGFARCLRADMKPYNVTVTLGYPPTTATPGLDRENETKPAESWAIEGKSKVYTAEQVARSLLRGTARGKFEVVTGAGSWFIWISMRLMPWLGHYIMDRELKKFRSKNQAERS